jgi:hypothetical protein
LEVNHLGEKTDNKASMLEWSTHEENCQHSADHKINFRQVSVQRIDPITNEVIKTYPSITSAKDDGFVISNIDSALKSGYKHKGFYWKYTEEKKEVEIVDEKWFELKNCIHDEIKCFPKYQISDHGRIRGWFGNILEINYSNTVGTIKLTNDIETKVFKVHRLVLMASNTLNPENKPEVDHIDSDCTNNKLNNLRWATRKEQMLNPETVSKFHKPCNSSRKKIEIIYGGITKIYEGLNALSKEIGIAPVTISKYANLGTEYKGYKFKIL